MATVSSSFTSLATAEAGYAAISGGFGLDSALAWGQAAFDYANYYPVSSYSVATSTYVAGTLSNGDHFAGVGTNLKSYPYTLSRLDYQFLTQEISVSQYGSVSKTYAGGSLSGYINKLEVSSATYGKVTVLGYDNVAVAGDGTISSVTYEKGGATLTESCNLAASVSVGGDGYYYATHTGTYSALTFSYASQSMEISGIFVDANSSFASVSDFLTVVLAGNDQISGTVGAEALYGFGASDSLIGDSGDDTLDGGAGNDVLDGGLGQDVAVFSGQKAGYTVTRAGSGYTVTDTNVGDGDEGLDTLSGIEKLQFADGTVTLGARISDPGGDGKSDLLVRNADGATLLWQMNGTTTTSSATLLGPGSWSIANGHGDYNGDGKSDLLVQNSNGDTRLWLMNGSAITSSTILLGPGNWRVIDGQGDYDGDGKSDLLVRNSNGDTRMWLMNGTTTSSSSTVLGAGNWSVVEGHGDYNGDGKSDLIVRNADGETRMWLMNGSQVTASTTLLGGGNWSVISGHGDYNGDGKSDLIVRNANGDTRMWLMNGTTTTGSSVLLGPGSWRAIDGQGDYDGDGKSDLLVQNSNGETRLWLMDGTTTSSSAVLLGPGSWGVADGHSDTNGDGKSDLVVQNSNGDTRLWLMNGTTTSSSTVLLGPGAWSTWQTEQGGVVTGDAGANSLTGTTGNDQLYGNAGNDSLSGGGGNDQFVFNTALNAGTNVDTITDFSRGADQVLLDHLIFTALGVGNLAAGSFVAEAGAIAHDGNDVILYDTTTGNLSYDPDGTGAGAATLFANLATHPAIVAGDLAVI
jgi:Ca2+-binding RTX toxin-like protein